MVSPRKSPVQRICFQCGNPYTSSPLATHSRYCNSDCKLAYYRAKKPLGPRQRLWTAADVAFLKANYREMGPRVIAKRLGRTVNCVRTKACLVGAPTTLWDEYEIAYLMAHFKTDGLDAVAAHLKRPRSGVRAKASKFGLLTVIRKSKPVPTIKTRVIAEAVAAANGLTIGEILSFSRRRQICVARWQLMRVLRDHNYSLSRIGISLGMDHTTVGYGLKRHSEIMAQQQREAAE